MSKPVPGADTLLTVGEVDRTERPITDYLWSVDPPAEDGNEKQRRGRRVTSWTAVELRKALRALRMLPDRRPGRGIPADEPGGRLARDEHIVTGTGPPAAEVIPRPATATVRKHEREARAEPAAASHLLPSRRQAEAGFEAEPG